jgi:hypothetical protein
MAQRGQKPHVAWHETEAGRARCETSLDQREGTMCRHRLSQGPERLNTRSIGLNEEHRRASAARQRISPPGDDPDAAPMAEG